MSNDGNYVRGVVHGKIIELEKELGLADGQEVTVSVHPLVAQPDHIGEGLRRSTGAWADDPEGLDAYLEQNRRARQIDRSGIES